MKVGQLHALLEDLIADGLEDQKIRFVYQQNYPLQDEIKGVWINYDLLNPENKEELVCYIVSAGQCYDQPYGPREAFDECQRP
jgi:hypothetical protein